MNRRGFLSSCLALAAAPAIVRADSLMRVIPREALVLVERIAPMEIAPPFDEYVITAVSGNTFSTIAEITAEALRVMHRSQVMLGRSSFADFKVGDRFTIAREKPGATIRVRLPERE